MDFIAIWKQVIENKNSWVLFENGTVVIFLAGKVPPEIGKEAIQCLSSLEIQDVVIAELIGQGRGWTVNCGNDFILNYLPHGNYESRYNRLIEMIAMQRKDQAGLKIIHIEKKE